MPKQPVQIKLFASVTLPGNIQSTEQAEALLTRADQEIELRVRTPFSSVEDLEAFAQILAQTTERVLVSVRHADWHKPYVIRDNPHGFFSFQAITWGEKREQERAENPRIKIMDVAISQTLNAAEEQIALRKFGEPRRKPRAGERKPLYERKLLPLEQALWVARELAGVSEITLLPATPSSASRNAYPITVTVATVQGMEALKHGIALLVEGKTPLNAAREIIRDTVNAASRTMRERNNQRIKAYQSVWTQVCAQRGYGDPLAQRRACVCRDDYPPPPRDFGEALEQWVAQMRDHRPHQPICYERLIDFMTYRSDWGLAEDYQVYEVGKRHSLIAYYGRKLVEARTQNPE